MTISSTTRKAGPFSGNGVTVAFPFTFKVFQASDLLVVLTDASGVETTQTLTSQYTVGLNANQDSNPGGTITMLAPPAIGALLTVGSQVAQTQPAVLTNTGGFYPTVVNDMVDRATILVQQLAEKVGRSITLAFSDPSSVTPTLPPAALRAGKALVFDDSGALGLSSNIAAQAAAAAASRLAIDNRIYPGTYTADPTTRPDGSAIQEGDRYYRSTDNNERIRRSGAWVNYEAGAAASAASALTQANNATGSAQGAAISAAAASVAKTAAEAARDAANSTGKVFASTTAGIAGTTSGQSFSVVDASGLFYVVYQNNAGVASELVRNYTKAYLDSIALPLAPESGYAMAIVDTVGRAIQLVGLDGTIYPQKIVLPTGVVSLSMLNTVLRALVGEVLAPETGYAKVIVDQAGRMVLGIPLSGGPIEAHVTRSVRVDSTGPKENSAYVVQGFIDGAGNRQIKSYRKSDGRVAAITSVGNNYDICLTSDNKVLYTSDASGVEVQRYLPADGGTSGLLAPDASIDCWGDSLSADTFEAGLAATLGRTVRAWGIPSQISAEIMARQGGVPALLTVTGNQIPASGAVAITAFSVDFLASLANPTGTYAMTGTLAGIPGTLTKSGSPSTYSFTRTAAGSITACPANTPFITDAGVTGRTSIPVIFAGTNDVIYGVSAATLLANVVAGMAYRSTYLKRGIVIGPLNRSDQPSGSAFYNMTVAMENALAGAAAANGYVFLNMRRYLIDSGLAALGITPTTQDLADIANDIPPSSLRVDTVHLTAGGYSLIAARLAAIVNTQGF